MKKEGETHVQKKNCQKNKNKTLYKSFHIRNLKKLSFFPYYTSPYIGTLRNIAHGQISSRATCY